MTRPLRLEFPGALYHVTSRGQRQTSIFFDNDDRRQWLAILGLVCACFNLVVHAYCQMENHFHLMIETVEGNLSQGMRQLNAIYSQKFNRRHALVGHVLQGRYKAILAPQRGRCRQTDTGSTLLISATKSNALEVPAFVGRTRLIRAMESRLRTAKVRG